MSPEIALGPADISLQGIAKSMKDLRGFNHDNDFIGESLPLQLDFATAGASPNDDGHGGARQDSKSFDHSRREADRRDTSWASTARVIPGLTTLTKEAFQKFPAMEAIRQAMHKMETASLNRIQKHEGVDIESLRRYMPDKVEADNLVALFFDSVGRVYDTLDQLSFQLDYETVWASSTGNKPYQLVVSLLVMATAMCLQSTTVVSLPDSPPSYRDRATSIINICHLWLDQHPSRLYRVIELQAHFLLLLAETLNARRYKQTYANAGKLVRMFMCAGLPGGSVRRRGHTTSSQEANIRQKLWMAVVELELQAAFEQGMPPMVLRDNSNPATEVGVSSQSTTNADISFLMALHDSFPLRQRLCQLLNTNSRRFTLPEVKDLSEELQRQVDRTVPQEKTSLHAIPLMMELTIKQYQLALYRHQWNTATTAFEHSVYQALLAETAKMTIEGQDAIFDSSSHAMMLICACQIQPALAVAEISIRALSSAQSRTSGGPVDEKSDVLIDRAVQRTRSRVVSQTGDQRQLWTVIAARTLVRINQEPHRRQYLLREAVHEYTQTFLDAGVPLNFDSEQKNVADHCSLDIDEPSDSALLGLLETPATWSLQDVFLDDWDLDLFNNQ